MSKGLLCYLVRVNDFDHVISSIELMTVVNEFQDVFLDDFRGFHPPRENDFCIDLEPDTKPISIPTYFGSS